jgi:trk system potassium uptake protein TrkH
MEYSFSKISSVGKFMMLIGILVAIPLLVIPFNMQDNKHASSFIIPASFSLICGLILFLYGKKRRETVGNFGWKSSMQYSSIMVLFAWVWGMLIGAFPFFSSGQLRLIQSLFESISGWTTTGLSVMDTSTTPRIFLFHRSFMQFCGGLGFIMMMNMFIQEKQSMRLYDAEGHPDKLLPNLRKTTQLIFLMYGGLLIAGTLLYRIVGMNIFESLLHAMCSLSTGGFSTRLGSIGEYNSIGIEVVTIILMVFGTTNFAVLFLIFTMKLRQVVRVSEVQLLFGLLCVGIPVFALGLQRNLQAMGIESFRLAIFNVISALSTTGYSTVDFRGMAPSSLGVIIIMMLIGGGIGSTAGGMKLERVYIGIKIIALNFRTRINPARNIHPGFFFKAQGKHMIDEKLILETTAHILCYLSIVGVGTILLAATAKANLIDALFEFASAFGTVGLSIGITNADLGNAALLVEMFAMVLGRLEIFIVFIAFHSSIELMRSRFQTIGSKGLNTQVL